MLNRSILIGRFTADPTLRYTPSGVAVTQFTLAVDRPFTNAQGEKEADFIPIVTWKQLAEAVANHMTKGRLVAVEGRIQVRNYENNEGKRIYVTEVVADNVRYLDHAPDRGGNSASRSGSGHGNQSSGHGGTPNGNRDPFDDGRPIDISQDDLPF